MKKALLAAILTLTSIGCATDSAELVDIMSAAELEFFLRSDRSVCEKADYLREGGDVYYYATPASDEMITRCHAQRIMEAFYRTDSGLTWEAYSWARFVASELGYDTRWADLETREPGYYVLYAQHRYTDALIILERPRHLPAPLGPRPDDIFWE